MCFRRSEGIWPAGNGFGMGFKSPLAHSQKVVPDQRKRWTGATFFRAPYPNVHKPGVRWFCSPPAAATQPPRIGGEGHRTGRKEPRSCD